MRQLLKYILERVDSYFISIQYVHENWTLHIAESQLCHIVTAIDLPFSQIKIKKQNYKVQNQSSKLEGP